MLYVREFLLVQFLLIFCKVSGEVVAETVVDGGSDSDSVSVVFMDYDGEFYTNVKEKQSYKSLKFVHSNISRIPKNIASKYPNVTSLDLSECGIASISSDDFADLFACEVLNLSYNSVGNLDDDVFTNLPNLKELSLAGMSLTQLQDNLFHRQTELITLDLQKNQIDDISSEMFKPLKKLQWINLSHNIISWLPSELFVFNQNLHTIDLSSNEITYIDSDAFLNTSPKLSNLFLQNNCFKNLRAPQCTTLSAHDACLRNLELIGPIGFLSLASNNFGKIPEIDYSGVIFMDISNNHIFEIDSIQNATKLEKLNLSSNYISSLQEDSFKGLINLQQLYLAKNKLTSEMVHNEKVFADLQNLEVLDLSGNHLDEIKIKQFQNLPKFQKLIISNSEFNGLQTILLNK